MSVSSPTSSCDSRVPAPQGDFSAATLVVEQQEWKCHLVEVSLDGFGVSVPMAVPLEGEPIGTLTTCESTYPVRIIRQQAEEGGCRFILKRLEPDDPALRKSRKSLPQWMIAAACGCAAGLIGLIASDAGFRPDIPSRSVKVLSVARAVRHVQSWWQTGDYRLAESDEPDSKGEPSTLNRRRPDQLLDMPAIAVSLSADDRARGKSARSDSSLAEANLDPQAAEIAKATRLAQFKASLLSVRRGPRQPANSDTLPWLFSTGDTTLNNNRSYRISELAARDLSLFESGLSSLPVTTSHEATRSLRRALAAMATTAGLPAELEELPEVRLIRSDDAVIYYRRTTDSLDILRVVPRETPSATSARSSSPTSGLPPGSMQR